MALHFECRINKNALLRFRLFFGDLAHWAFASCVSLKGIYRIRKKNVSLSCKNISLPKVAGSDFPVNLKSIKSMILKIKMNIK